MKTNFFSQLQHLGVKSCALSITFDNDNISVSILPQASIDDPAINQLHPLDLSANVTEMDELFFEQILKPIEATNSFINNAEAYQLSLKQAEDKSKHKKSVKDKSSKLIEKLKSFCENKDFNALKDHEKATKLAKDIISIEAKNKYANKVIKTLEVYAKPTLF